MRDLARSSIQLPSMPPMLHGVSSSGIEFELKIDALHTIQFEWIEMIWKFNSNDFQVIVQLW